MITYTDEAQKSYIQKIEKLQEELGHIPISIIGYEDMFFLIHIALNDLKEVVEKEH